MRAASITDVESSARIIAPLTISIEGSGVLAFGDFITTNNGIAQVNINPQTGARSQTGGITLAGGEVSNLVLKDAYDLPMG